MSNPRRTLARRVRAGLLLAAFLAAPAGNLFAHGCSHHERLATEHAAAPLADDEPSTAHVAEHSPSPESPRSSHGSDSHQVPCTCVGVCHATPTPADAAAALRILVISPADAASGASAATDAVRPDRTALRLLPFANGPPRTN